MPYISLRYFTRKLKRRIYSALLLLYFDIPRLLDVKLTPGLGLTKRHVYCWLVAIPHQIDDFQDSGLHEVLGWKYFSLELVLQTQRYYQFARVSAEWMVKATSQLTFSRAQKKKKAEKIKRTRERGSFSVKLAAKKSAGVPGRRNDSFWPQVL